MTGLACAYWNGDEMGVEEGWGKGKVWGKKGSLVKGKGRREVWGERVRRKVGIGES